MSNYDMDPTRIKSILSSGEMSRNKSDFQVFSYCDVSYKLFPIRRKLSFSEIRISPKSEYECMEEFLVHSVVKEKFGEESEINISWKHIDTHVCSTAELEAFYCEIHGDISNFPKIPEIISSVHIDTRSNFNWLFLEDGDNYYSIFWRNAVSEFFKRCA